jgi:hypothetical protein
MLPVERSRDSTTNRLRCTAKGIGIEVGVPLRRCRLRMPQYLAYNRQAKPITCTKARIRVSKVVESNAIESGMSRHCLPWTLQISTRLLGIVTRHDIGAKPIEAGQRRECRGVQNHGFPAGLGVREKQQPALQIYLFPFEVQDFPESTAGEQQQSDRCRGEGTDLGEAVFGLRQVFGRGLSLVHVPRNALSFRLTDDPPKPFQFLVAQKALAAVLLELLDPAGGVHALSDNAAAPREGVHAADHGQDAIGLERRRLELPVQPRDLRASDLVGLADAEFRLDDLVKQESVERDGSRLAFLLDVLGHESVGQSGDRECATFAGLLSRRILTMRHRSQDGLCAPSGGLWRGQRRTGAPRPEPAR